MLKQMAFLLFLLELFRSNIIQKHASSLQKETACFFIIVSSMIWFDLLNQFYTRNSTCFSLISSIWTY